MLTEFSYLKLDKKENRNNGISDLQPKNNWLAISENQTPYQCNNVINSL